MTLRRLMAALALFWSLAAVPGLAEDVSIRVASTTSTEQSGLFGHILPLFKAKTGIDVRVIALGTGQALDAGRRGDVDVVFVHDRAAEDKFLAEGWGVGRRDVMYNDFVLIGPQDDPAKIKGVKDAVAALKQIAAVKATFVSRGDRSGTHAAELRLWTLAAIDVKPASGTWYLDTGSGMGPALNTASAKNAYILSDRGTWLSFANRRALVVLSEGDARLFNPYGVMLVNPAKHPHVKKAAGMKFIDWLTGADGQAAIASYKVGGEQLFFPSAKK